MIPGGCETESRVQSSLKNLTSKMSERKISNFIKMEMIANKFISGSAYTKMSNEVQAQKALESNYLYDNIRAVSPKNYTNLHLDSSKNTNLR